MPGCRNGDPHWIAAIRFFALLLLTPLALGAQALPFLDRVETYRLRNGLTVVLAPDSALPHAGVELWLPSGSRFDPVGQRGTAHLLEHVSAALAAPLDRDGLRLAQPRFADSNAQVRRDHARYFLLVDGGALDAALATHAARLALDERMITDSVVRAHADIVVNEGRTEVSTLTTRGLEPFWRLQVGAYGAGHPYGMIGESEASVRSITAEDLRKFARERMGVHDGVLLVVGNFDPAVARERITTRFAPIVPRDSSAERITRTLPPRLALERVRTRALRGPSRLTRRFVLPPLGDPALEASELALRVVIARWESRAGSAIKGRPTLSAQPGALATDLTVDVEVVDLERASSTLNDVIAEISGARGAATMLTAAELAAARNAARAALLGAIDRIGFQRSRTEQIGEGIFFAGDARLVGTRYGRFATLPLEAVRDAASEWLNGRGFELGLEAPATFASEGTLRTDAPLVMSAAPTIAVPVTIDTTIAGVRVIATAMRTLPLVRINVVTAPAGDTPPADRVELSERDQLETTFARLAAPARPKTRTTIHVTGDIDRKRIAIAVARMVAAWPAGSAAPTRTIAAFAPGESRVPESARAQVRILVEWRVPARDAAEEIAARLLRRQLSASINTVLRTERRWSYGANGSSVVEGDSVRVTITAEVQPDKAREALAEVRRLIAEFRSGATAMPEVTVLRERLRNELLLDQGSIAAYQQAMRADIDAGRSAAWRGALLKRIDALSATDLATARALADPVRARIVLTGDPNALP